VIRRAVAAPEHDLLRLFSDQRINDLVKT
jgi:hypothetical protein